jgi:NAD(P)-dependent dehydrogenase (short-subunit alcohol dehydrogenase family)
LVDMTKGHAALGGKVVVITGASSGVGRATAIAFAALGCRLVLAARRAEDLATTAELCAAAGGTAINVPTDVTREDEVLRLVQSACDRFGTIDIWINNAGVTVFGTLEEAPFAEHRRVIETNLFGAMLGARAVLPLFKQRRRGTLIMLGSVLSKVGQPFVPSYAISKFAVRGLAESLLVEVAEEPDIHVCSIYPYTIDTPHFQSGANLSGRRTRALQPIQSPEKVAQAIVDLAARPRRELHVPRFIALGFLAYQLFPHTADRLLLRALRRWFFDEHRQAPTSGNLRQPVERGEAAIHGRRPPMTSTFRFFAWTARELVRMAAPQRQP